MVNIFNLSLQSEIFPDDWKLARITLIYKDGLKQNAVIIDLFLKYLLLPKYLKYHSTETTLLDSTN